MKYIVAVSGGVDSVVLLDMLVREAKHELVVAHFDHGIRTDSAADAHFVATLAKNYELPFETSREELGKNASEETARTRRYAFLRTVAKKYGGTIVTAHHKNDLIETIAINLTRGTGWRGLAVFGDQTVVRPLVTRTKAELYDYALAHGLEWVEDSTNSDTKYLRNRVRAKSNQSLTTEMQETLLTMWRRQSLLRSEIDVRTDSLIHGQEKTSRYFFTNINTAVAIELLAAVLRSHDVSLTRPNRQRMLHAIKTATPGSTFEAGSGVNVVFTAREFIVKNTLKLV